jgi:predicted phage-related endonuclease
MNFEVLNLTQGTTEWKAHRASHFNASDAPAMMGSSPNKGRHELVKELASGIERDFSSYVQERVLDKGHTFEAHARRAKKQCNDS